MLALKRPGPSQIETISIELISGMFLILGLAPFFFLFITLVTDPTMIAARQEGGTGGVLAFLNTLGIILPLLLIFLGIFSFRIGLQLRRRQISAADQPACLCDGEFRRIGTLRLWPLSTPLPARLPSAPGSAMWCHHWSPL